MLDRDIPEDTRLGVPEMDEEHSVQVRLLRALKNTVKRSEWKRAGELIDELDDYTNMHFLLEETLMVQRAYPGRQAHREEHSHLIEKLRSLRSAVASAGEARQLSEADAIEEWLFRHIRTFDRAFATYLADQSRGPQSRNAPAED